jgi:hypothetical protein
MKISQRPTVRSCGAALAAALMLAAPIAAALFFKGRTSHQALNIVFWMGVLIVFVYVQDRWLLAALKRWVWSQHVRLTLHAGPEEVFSRPFIIEKGTKFQTGDGTVYESIVDTAVSPGSVKTEVVARRISR